MASPSSITRMLDCISSEILPLTRDRVAQGDKVFGAAVLRRAGLHTLVAGTNHETACPLFHGEVYVIQEWSAARTGVAAADAVFLATHEPCCMCISAVVWAGFRECYFLFPYEDTRAQGIPHDLDIMRELWRVERYNADNKFCRTRGLVPMILEVEDEAVRKQLMAKVDVLTEAYRLLSEKYHAEKQANSENTLAFN